MTLPSRPIRFGVLTFEAESFEVLRARWARLESLGVDALWVGDHLWSGSVDGVVQRPRFDAWVVLAALAVATSRVSVGTLVSSLAYRTPAVVAKQAITIDHLSGGRVEVGVGAGANPRDSTASGLPPLSAGERAEAFRVSVEAFARLVADDRVTYSGGSLRFDDVVAAPRPVQRPSPPLVIAAHLDSSLRVAATLGDGWISYAGRSSPGRSAGLVLAPDALAMTAARVRRLEEVAAEAGRDPGRLRRLLLAGFTDDPWSESPTALVEFVGRYRSVGIDEFVFPFPTSGLNDAGFESLLDDAMPQVRVNDVQA